VVQKIDRRNVIEMGHDPSDTEEPLGDISPLPARRHRHNQTVVRDVTWHSQEPVLMTCSWASDRRPTSDVAKHEWKGLNKLGGRLEDFVAREEEEAKERRIPSSGGWYR
jgi:DDB1- and CUL4-associated factor 11